MRDEMKGTKLTKDDFLDLGQAGFLALLAEKRHKRGVALGGRCVPSRPLL
jgi:hypothetical protein